MLLVVALCAATNRLFVTFADVESYMAASERMVRMSKTADDTLAAMIRDDEVTWDPTNGEKMAQVLAHLEATDRVKILMVGSSQFLVVRDDISPTYSNRRVDRILQRLVRKPAQVYNLSTGGMTTRDKAVVVDRASQVVPFDVIIVGLTPWDSLSPNLRPPLNTLPDRIVRAREPGKAGLDYWLDPSGINRAGKQAAWNLLERNLPFIRRRSGIQSWLRDMTTGRVHGRRESPPAGGIPLPTPAEATPVQYDYSPGDRRETIGRNVGRLFDSLRATRAGKARVAILLTPVRYDARLPAYLPVDFYPEFVRDVRAQCQAYGFDLLDATTVLAPSHFGVYQGGESSGKIDVLHFDAAGHKILAEFIAQSLELK